MQGDTLYAWGGGHTGIPGQGPGRDTLRPQVVPGLPWVRRVEAGPVSAYAIDGDGAVWSWGWDGHHHLLGRGLGDFPLPRGMRRPADGGAPRDGGVGTPGRIEGLPPVSNVVAGPEAVIARAVDGTVWGWGAAEGLGAPTEEAAATPVCIEGLGDIAAVSRSPGSLTFLARGAQSRIWSWGDGHEGQLGWGKRRYQAAPALVPTLDEVRRVHAAGSFCWAVRHDDTVWFWGNGQRFDLKAGGSYRVLEPMRIAALDGTAALFVGPQCVVARRRTGEMVGLGVGLGDLLEDEAEPGDPGLVRLEGCDAFETISIGASHALGIDSAGGLHAFGDADSGALGNGSRRAGDIHPPGPVDGLDVVTSARAGNACSLAIAPGPATG